MDHVISKNWKYYKCLPKEGFNLNGQGIQSAVIMWVFLNVIKQTYQQFLIIIIKPKKNKIVKHKQYDPI